jgi:hypothetical protein
MSFKICIIGDLGKGTITTTKKKEYWMCRELQYEHDEIAVNIARSIATI